MDEHVTHHPSASSDAWSHAMLGEQNFWSAKGFLAWWYRVSAPPPAPLGATFQQRDLVRRGRIASAILLFLAAILLLVAPLGWFGPNKQILYTALIVWATIAVCVVLNRRKHVNLVGCLLCLAVNTGMYVSILRAPGGLGVDDKDILYLLVFSELLLGAILPASWIVIPLVVNLAFSVCALTLLPHTPALTGLLQSSQFLIVFRVFQMHLLITGVLWILNIHARESVQRANQAEEVARLQRDMGHLATARVQEAEQLTQAVEGLVQTLTQVMRGSLQARVPNQHGGSFWALGALLNSLLTRYQRAVMDAREVQLLRLTVHQHKTTHQIASQLTREQALVQEAIVEALREQCPLRLPEEVVLLEPFLHPLLGCRIVSPSVAMPTTWTESPLPAGNVTASIPPEVSFLSPSMPVREAPLHMQETLVLGARPLMESETPLRPFTPTQHQFMVSPTSFKGTNGDHA
ncbi:hypothetical protein [Ktedonospora formicarum]|uniref:HAMP domain-containing protein n=1 Tax=Ktedonospora formicarum TaxID=2778364 RepID=A0A8J3I935_9CHLR|nr:hypothetical protein [Ktedonospora formicarum]GHO50901.1 hypothetical protein KSX_90640 [Ktedonospora formicarum]